MEKTVKKIAEFVNEIANEFNLCEEVSMRVLEAAAGGIENVADWMEENVNSCSCCDCDDEDDYDDEDEDDCDDEDEDDGGVAIVDSKNRVLIPEEIIKSAENINGKLNSKKNGYGTLTVIREDDRITVMFGNKTDEYEDASIIHPNAHGKVCFSVDPIFDAGTILNCSLLDDGTIILD